MLGSGIIRHFPARGVVADVSSITTPVEMFRQIFIVFLVLGTLVGVVVLAYLLYNTVKYRDGNGESPEDVDRPEMGELPSGGGKGKKLAVSFAISAVIVVSLVAWTYTLLLQYESTPEQENVNLTVDVIGQQFSWTFIYPNGHRSPTLRVPRGQVVQLNVTSTDVMHNIGIPELRVKTDAIPGQTTTAWFYAEETGTYLAKCYELCGRGHSGMESKVIVMEPDEYREWYNSTMNASAQQASTDGPTAGPTSESASREGSA